jgi:cell division septal protein FtsQ
MKKASRQFRGLLGSKRPSRIKDVRDVLRYRAPRRRQTIRFRSRYAKSILSKTGTSLWSVGQIAFVVGVLIWGYSLTRHALRNSNYLKVQGIQFDENLPSQIKILVPIKPGDNVFSFNSGLIENSIMEKYPELKKISVRRTFSRTIVVEGKKCLFILRTARVNEVWGVDEEGVVFPFSETPGNLSDLPFFEANKINESKVQVKWLMKMKENSPELFSRVALCRLGAGDELKIQLKNGVEIQWGTIDEKSLNERSQNILRLLESFVPVGEPATLKFITSDRIVMNNNWVKS